jgi:hypothetical protein
MSSIFTKIVNGEILVIAEDDHYLAFGCKSNAKGIRFVYKI